LRVSPRPTLWVFSCWKVFLAFFFNHPFSPEITKN
jgi:hypothetical protein